MFELQRAIRIEPQCVANDRLRELFQYWQRQCRTGGRPHHDDIDPTEIRRNVGRMHVLAVEGPGIYRYRIYGSAVTNPDRSEMTGKTTRDYEDQNFARFVTAHMDEAYALGQPTCYQIDALTHGEPYRYIRMILPLGDEGGISHLLVGTQRIEVPESMHREILSAL
jgi:hypothetical protein